MIQVLLPGLTLANEYSATVPYLSNAESLLDGLTVESHREVRPGGGGEFPDDYPDVPGLEFTVFGELRAIGGDWFAVRRAVTALSALGWFEIQVVIDTHEWFMRVRVDGKPTFDLIDERGLADFSIPLLAPDARKYGPERTTQTGLPVAGVGIAEPLASPLAEGAPGNPGRLVLTNSGTADTPVRLQVTGGMSQGTELTRVETGERLRLEWPIAAGNTVLFDFAEGQVWLDGQSPITGYLTKADWWSLGPGETATVQFAALGDVTGAPMLTATWREADT